MRPRLSVPLDSVSVECKSICWFNPNFGDRYAAASLRASSRSGVGVPFLFSLREIGKSEERSESELPCVGRRFGETFAVGTRVGNKAGKQEREDKKPDESCFSGGRDACHRCCRIQFCDPSIRRCGARVAI